MSVASILKVKGGEVVTASAEASVGDPIPLTVRIRGPEPMPGVRPPDQTVQRQGHERL